jgi:hypothetical protein
LRAGERAGRTEGPRAGGEARRGNSRKEGRAWGEICVRFVRVGRGVRPICRGGRGLLEDVSDGRRRVADEEPGEKEAQEPAAKEVMLRTNGRTNGRSGGRV